MSSIYKLSIQLGSLVACAERRSCTVIARSVQCTKWKQLLLIAHASKHLRAVCSTN